MKGLRNFLTEWLRFRVLKKARTCVIIKMQVRVSFLKGEIILNYNRRDHKNRRLKEGESQRADKRYRFTYVDLDGNKRDVYSWRLDKNDPHPEGKRKDLSLREKEKQIE